MLKKGYIYSVRDYDNNPHKIVLMEDYDGVSTRIKAVAFTHNEKGTSKYPNKPINKEFFVEMDENGNLYKFQWECLGVGRSTSIILHGFEKIVLNIKSRIIGQITEEGLKWIAEHVETYIICDVDIKTESQS